MFQENGIQGKVKVRFYVNPKGQIQDVSLLESVCPELDDIALATIKSMSGWEPQIIGGKPVYTYIVLPLNFSLR